MILSSKAKCSPAPVKVKYADLVLILMLLLFVHGVGAQMVYGQDSGSPSARALAKFEPPNGQFLFFIGQDLGAIGGLDQYKDGYCDNFDVPTGFTTYTNFSPGGESFGFTARGNDGIKSKANWGAGDNCARCVIDDPDFQYSLVSIGLSLVDHEKAVAKGNRDHLIRELGDWIKGLGRRPVFLRIGYEFDGWEWNHYKKKHYLDAWERIHSVFAEMEVNNVAFVWQSKGTGTDQETLEDWYPGDELVDWCGYSYFGNPDEEMLVFARKHAKPVFIAEATPVFEMDGLYFDTRLSNPKIAERAWGQWFLPFLETIHKNADIIKAFSYINVNWSAQAMWVINPTFQQVDSRIQVSEYLSERWRAEMTKPSYLKPRALLWETLWKE